MRRKTIACAAMWLCLALAPWLQSVGRASEVPQARTIKEITKDIDTHEKRSAAIAKLSIIVKDSTQNEMLRMFATYELGELGAVEARDMLKELAESIEWTDSAQQQLKRVAFLAYWQIRVAQEASEEKQVQLLKQALNESFDGYEAGNVQGWAVDELANRGIKEALPEIIKTVRSHYSGKYGEDRVLLCRTKIELLSSSENRQEALSKALVTEDTSQYQRLKRWAIKELGKLGTEGSRMILINYALGLQKEYYDENGNRIAQEDGLGTRNASRLYNMIIHALRGNGMTEREIEATGLLPGRLFISV